MANVLKWAESAQEIIVDLSIHILQETLQESRLIRNEFDQLYSLIEQGRKASKSNFAELYDKIITCPIKLSMVHDQMTQILGRYKQIIVCLLYTSPSPRDRQKSRMPSSA
eukprot:TRINITY_DN15916_c0_g1_i1.p1 TRINITY_DN15916_c0_g1~~TRINITY_DN15916_c0_g1_i1.p1  ORF type:complete len:110 (+),score=6.37 TRINITY_DN15916_c0_g1_i1:125-454(+)